MPDGVVSVTLVVGFGFILIAGSRLGAGSHHALAGLFAQHGVRDWPRGVQETDAPRFAVRHLDALRPGQATLIDTSTADEGAADGCRTELFDLGSRRLGAPRA